MVEREKLDKDIANRVDGDAYYTVYLYRVNEGVEEIMNTDGVGGRVFRMNGNPIEKMYLFNAGFRLANLSLKGTEYEKIPWEYFVERPKAISDDVYVKRLDENNYVYMVFEYYYHT